MKEINEAISQLVCELIKVNNSPEQLTQDKTRKALSDIKRARTLLEKAEQTLKWAQCRNKVLIEVFMAES